jgi:hypothetical protein
MRWYIAGKITGNAAYREQFAAAAAKLCAEGFDVVNPAENPEHPDWLGYMRTSLTQLIACDAVAFLPNWAESRGATLEHHVAEQLKMPRLYL